MRRNIFYDKINIAYGNRENELSNDIFRRNFEQIFSTFSKLLYKLQKVRVVIWIKEKKHKFLTFKTI